MRLKEKCQTRKLGLALSKENLYAALSIQLYEFFGELIP